jgi:hypothetical protein
MVTGRITRFLFLSNREVSQKGPDVSAVDDTYFTSLILSNPPPTHQNQSITKSVIFILQLQPVRYHEQIDGFMKTEV